MKFICLSLCFISFLLVGEVFCSWFNMELEEEEYPEIPEIDSYDEDPSGDYPQIFVSSGSENKGNGINTEENEVETGGNRPKPDVEITPEEHEQPKNDFGPLPDFETPTSDNLTERFDKLLSDFKAQQDKIFELEEANKKLILKIDSIEQQTKSNSIILTNVRQLANENFRMTLQKVLHIFNRIMKVRISASEIAVALRAQSNLSAGDNPIIVRFTNFVTKMKVLSASNRLKNTNIGISSDYSELVAQRRAALLPYLNQARAQGIRAYILYDKLVMDGVRMTLEELIAQEHKEEPCVEQSGQVEKITEDF